jgi:hypothetical protein
VAALVLGFVQVEGSPAGEGGGCCLVGVDDGDGHVGGAGKGLPGELGDPAQDGRQVMVAQLDLAEFGKGGLRFERYRGDDGLQRLRALARNAVTTASGAIALGAPCWGCCRAARPRPGPALC